MRESQELTSMLQFATRTLMSRCKVPAFGMMHTGLGYPASGLLVTMCLQCFDAVGWAAGTASGL